MKKSQQQGKASRKNYAIQDYGHDRTVHSLGRGGSTARRQQGHRRLAVIVFALIVVLAFGLWQLQLFLPLKVPAETTLSSTAQITTIPSVSTAATTSQTAGTTAAAKTLSPAQRQSLLQKAADQVLALIQNEPGRFGIYYKNLKVDENWQYEAEKPFVAASSIKLGINTYLYTQIAGGKISADEVLTFDNRNYPTGDFESGTGIIQNEANGTKFTVRETSGLSIRISDNCGTNMIIRRLGGIDAINPFLREISGAVDYRKSVTYKNYTGQTVSGKHRTCALDLGSHAVKLYRLWQESPTVYQPLLDDLCQTEFDFGIQKGVPSGIRVAHKIGTNGTYSAENDVGIIFAGEPFVLCVMTEMASAASARRLQAKISQIFYEYIVSCQNG